MLLIKLIPVRDPLVHYNTYSITTKNRGNKKNNGVTQKVMIRFLNQKLRSSATKLQGGCLVKGHLPENQSL
jgi:hypothetical protein